MAGITLSKSRGRWRLLFHDLNDASQRRQLSLGGVNKTAAERIRQHVEQLRSARIAGATPPDATAAWLADLPDGWHARLVDAGLVNPRVAISGESAQGRSDLTLGELIEKFESTAHWRGLAPGTRGTYARTWRHIRRRFGADRPVGEITVGDAKDLRPFLEGEKPDGCGLAHSTASATITQTKTLIEFAIDHELLTKNPFRKLRTTQYAAEKVEVSVAASLDVLKHLPSTEWKLFFALSRWGGLRVISEIRPLTWSDVDFENHDLGVTSPKTRRHPQGARRVIPLFDEIEPLLRQQFDEAAEGELYVLPNARRNKSVARDVLLRAIKRAGLDPWPELFNSLRATRETELIRAGVPINEVAQVLGHSTRIAERNYQLALSRDRRQAMRAASAAHNMRTEIRRTEGSGGEVNNAEGAVNPSCD